VSFTSAVWPYAEVPGVRGVYVCGCLERWVSIQLQATRALNLLWGLVSEGRVPRGGRVLVVGGGFAGLTAAAAFSRLGVKATLLERGKELLATQRNNRVRWIHPHIHEWPRKGSLEPSAGLPLLNWRAGLSADMAAEVLRGFEEERAQGRIEVRTGATTELKQLLEGYDAAVLALGVGIEKSFGALPLRSYWADEDIATVRSGPPRHHLVTGIGEGGVIDVLYLRLAGFSHHGLAQRLAGMPGMAAVERGLLELEASVEGLSDADANVELTLRTNALPIPRAMDDVLRSMLRSDTRVTLNGPEAHPLAARADIFNRLLISRLIALGALTYRPGKVKDIQPAGARWRVELDDGASLEVDEVNIRHGTVPTMKTGFPELWERYEPHRRALPHLVPQPMWPEGAWAF
jgi:hypothetical protein